MANLQGVILDVDGTLVDSNDAHAQAWMQALAEAGFDLPFERVRRLIGMGGDHLLPDLTGLQKESEQGEQISSRRGEILMQRYVPEVRPFPGVMELLSRMRQEGLTLVVASSAEEDEAQALLAIAGVEHLISVLTSSDDAARSKPDPDIVQAALDRSGLTAGQVVMLGDTPYDLRAATAAGVPLIAVRCGGWSDAELSGTLAIFDDPTDLLAHYERSPLYRSQPVR